MTYTHQYPALNDNWSEASNTMATLLQHQMAKSPWQQMGDTQHDIQSSQHHMPSWENMWAFYLSIKHWPMDIQTSEIEGNSLLIETMFNHSPKMQWLKTYAWSTNLATPMPRTDCTTDYATARLLILSLAKWTN